MLYLIVVLIILIILILIISFSDVTIYVMFRRTPEYQKAWTQIFFLNRFKLLDKKFVPLKDSEGKKRDKVLNKIDKYSEIVTKSIGTMSRYNDFLRDINNNLGNGLKTARLNLAVRIGTGDAAMTAILCGTVWAILGNLRMQKDYYNLFKNVEFAVNPDYKKKIFAVDVDSIFTIKTVYIIYVLVLLKQVINLEEKRIEAG